MSVRAIISTVGSNVDVHLLSFSCGDKSKFEPPTCGLCPPSISTTVNPARSDGKVTPPKRHMAMQCRPIRPATRPNSIKIFDRGVSTLLPRTRLWSSGVATNTAAQHRSSMFSKASKVMSPGSNTSVHNTDSTPSNDESRLQICLAFSSPSVEDPTKIGRFTYFPTVIIYLNGYLGLSAIS